MEGFCFVHAADLHLDSPFAAMKVDSPRLAQAFIEASRASLQALIDVCIGHNADFLVLSGDVFDAERRSIRAQLELFEALSRLAERGIDTYMACGNHDALSGWRAILDWPEEVHFFGGDEVESFPVSCGGRVAAVVSGISYAQPAVTDNLALKFRKKVGDPFTIGVLHANVGGDPGHENYAPCTLADLISTGIDYWALGHVHSPKVLSDKDPIVIYPGCTQGRNPRETGPGGCFVVHVGTGGWVEYEFVPVDVIRWHVLDISIDGLACVGDLIEEAKAAIGGLARASDGRSCAVRIRLFGRGPVHHQLVENGEAMDLVSAVVEPAMPGERFDWIESIQDFTKPEVDREALLSGGSLISDFLALADEAGSDLSGLEGVKEVLVGDLAHSKAAQVIREMDAEGLMRIVERAESIGIDLLLGEEG